MKKKDNMYFVYLGMIGIAATCGIYISPEYMGVIFMLGIICILLNMVLLNIKEVK